MQCGSLQFCYSTYTVAWLYYCIIHHHYTMSAAKIKSPDSAHTT